MTNLNKYIQNRTYRAIWKKTVAIDFMNDIANRLSQSGFLVNTII